MIKNERHSHAAKMLARARELYKVYQIIIDCYAV